MLIGQTCPQLSDGLCTPAPTCNSASAWLVSLSLLARLRASAWDRDSCLSKDERAAVTCSQCSYTAQQHNRNCPDLRISIGPEMNHCDSCWSPLQLITSSSTFMISTYTIALATALLSTPFYSFSGLTCILTQTTHNPCTSCLVCTPEVMQCDRSKHDSCTL